MISVKYWLNLLEVKAQKENLTPFERYNYNMSKMNYDPRTKYIGDRVFVWDTSFIVDYESNDYIEIPAIIFQLLHSQGIVVEVEQTYEVVTNTIADIEFHDRIFLDLVVFFPNLGVKVRTHSDFVRLM